MRVCLQGELNSHTLHKQRLQNGKQKKYFMHLYTMAATIKPEEHRKIRR